MNDILHVALARLLKDQPDLPVGTVEVDETVTVHVKATVRRGEDETYVPTVSIPLKATMALLLHKAGFQRDQAAALLTAAMTDALNANVLGDTAVKALLADVDASMARVQAITTALPPATRAGKVTVRGTVAVVEPVEVE